MRLVRIVPGEFKMGSGESAEATAALFNKIYGKHVLDVVTVENEHPQHRVRITQPFYLGAYAVTRGQFRQFVALTNYKTDSEKGKLGASGWNSDKSRFEISKKYSWRYTGFDQSDTDPVVNVSWNDAVEFCKWLSIKESKRYQLPTEAQWEYACRGGSTTPYFFADDEKQLGEYAWYGGNSGFKTHPVGEKKPNAWGLYDMEGNVTQWCQDWYGGGYYATSPTDDPCGPAKGSDRVLRGGSWASLDWTCRSPHRFNWRSFPASNIGFRASLALTVKEEKE